MKATRHSANGFVFSAVQLLEPRRLMSLTASFDRPAAVGTSAPVGIVHSFGYEKSLGVTPQVRATVAEFEAQLIKSIARGIPMHDLDSLNTAIATASSLDDLYAQLPVSTATAIDQATEATLQKLSPSLRSPATMVTAAIVTTAYATAEIAKMKRGKDNLFSNSVLSMNPKLIPET